MKLIKGTTSCDDSGKKKPTGRFSKGGRKPAKR